MKIYLAGKVTGEVNYKSKFSNAAMCLRLRGYTVFCPIDYGLETITWQEAMRFLIPKMLECDGLALLPNWWKSKGARLERRIAKSLGILCMSVNKWLMLKKPVN